MLPFGLVCADLGCVEPGELVFEGGSFFLGCSGVADRCVAFPKTDFSR